ncbi:DM13 domain-containing protein [Saccharopolyspora taberi]|uniref:DM13 domain-containing protein n=1 Tax=Saccharopolyspora taberi TaxID=60895 RepID=A0ABN3VA50_9PSEU
MRRRTLAAVAVAVLVVLLGFGAWAFQPWRVWTQHTVDEALPSAPVTSSAPPAEPGTSPAPPPEPVELATGAFVAQEHETSGVARVVRLPDGSRLLRIEGLSTSDGPDLHVWLTDQTAGGEWSKYDDGRYLALGPLKGNRGSQNYPVPPDADLAGLTSVVIWCDRFNVAFGSAPLTSG